MRTDKVELMTLGSFEVTEHNAAEYAVCEALVRDPGTYRLVFICLPSDQRQHLKMALINGFADTQDLLSVSVSEFVDDLTSMIRRGKRSLSFSIYTEREILIVDDLNFLKGKEQTQEKFYRLLKQRLESRKLTVLFSEFGVDHLRRTFRDDLISYLNLGMHGKEE